MVIDDLHPVVDVHLRSFDGFFLTFLGGSFLHELYLSILDDPAGISYIYDDFGTIQGFVVGTSHPWGFYRRILIKRWWRFGLASIKPLIRNPAILPRLMRAFTKPSEVADDDQYCELMSLAVLPEHRGKGVGKALVNTFISDAYHQGIQTVKLTTDRMNNDAVNNFYQKIGFTCSRTFTTPEGRSMNEYRIDL